MNGVLSSSALTCKPFAAQMQQRAAKRVCRARLVTRSALKEDERDIRDVQPGELSNEAAEKRADIGKVRPPLPSEVQAFDGPAPETINSRLAMLGVTSALAAEFATGVGVKEQVAQQPVGIIMVFALISLASYVPIVRGYTRKEPFANSFWTPQAENWNGRLAMIGFLGLVITEALSGRSVVDTYGLPHGTFF